jgi:hypothetical protein
MRDAAVRSTVNIIEESYQVGVIDERKRHTPAILERLTLCLLVSPRGLRSSPNSRHLAAQR